MVSVIRKHCILPFLFVIRILCKIGINTIVSEELVV